MFIGFHKRCRIYMDLSITRIIISVFPQQQNGMKTHGQSLKLSILRSWSTAKSNKVTSTLGTSTKTTSPFDEINKTNKCKIKRDTPGMAFLQTNTSTIQNWVRTKNRQITNNKTAFTYNSNLSVYPLGCQQMGRPDFESQPNLATNNSEAAKQTPKSTAGLLDA